MRIRLTMNPGRSTDTMTCLPSSADSARIVASVSFVVAAPRISSMSGMTGTGLKKCMPTNVARRSSETASARRSIAIELVLEAKIVAGGASASSSCHSVGLHVDVLEDRLDHEVRLGNACPVVGGDDPPERRVALGVRQLALGDGTLEVAGDPVPTGGGPGEVRLVKRRPALPTAAWTWAIPWPMRPGAGDEDPFDRHPSSVAAPTATGRARSWRRSAMSRAPHPAAAAETRNAPA